MKIKLIRQFEINNQHIEYYQMQYSASLPRITLKDLNIAKFSSIQDDSLNYRLPKLYTVAQSLQDEYILKNLKPEIGTLNQFLHGNSPMRKEKTNKKKKNSNQKPQQTQEKRIRSHMLLRKKTPEDILKSNESSTLQRKVACKMILESIFTKQFGEDPDSFYNLNMRPKDWHQIPKPIQKFLTKFASNPPIEILLDKFINQQNSIPEESEDKLIESMKIQDNRETQQNQQLKKLLKYNPQKIKSELSKLKLKYKSLSKLKHISIGQQSSSLYEEEHKLKKQNSEYSVQDYEQDQQYKEECRKTRTVYKEDNKVTYISTHKYLVLKKLDLNIQFFLFVIYNFISYQSIKKIHLEQIQISEDLLCLFLEMISKYALLLESLTINNIECSEKVFIILQQLVASTNIKKLTLNKTNMTTKTFCRLCLGIGKNNSLTTFEANNNKIDTRALKSVQIIIRFINQLEYIDLTQNKFNHLDEKTIVFLNHNKAKTVLVGKQEQIKNS